MFEPSAGPSAPALRAAEAIAAGSSTDQRGVVPLAILIDQLTGLPEILDALCKAAIELDQIAHGTYAGAAERHTWRDANAAIARAKGEA